MWLVAVSPAKSFIYRASLLGFLPCLLSSFALGLVLLSWLCGLISLCVVVVGFLSRRMNRAQKERARIASLPVVCLICKITPRAVRLYICNTVFRCDFTAVAKIHKIEDICELSDFVKSELLCFASELFCCFHCFVILYC